MSNQQHSRSKTTQFAIDFIMGGTSGAIAKTICAPIERVKLLLQNQANIEKLEGAKKYNGIVDCFVRVVKEEGALALWRGNLANVLRYFPTQALNFSIKDYLNRLFCPFQANKNPFKFFLGSLLAGGIAGSISMVFVYPLDFARTRLAADLGRERTDRQFAGLSDCMKQIYKSDGIVGLYRGFQISVIGIFVYRAFYFGGYDTGKRLVFGEDPNNQPSRILKFFFAQFVVSTSETISYPLDTVRRRLMLQSGKKEMTYSGTTDCFNKIYAKEGINGFFKGNISNIWRSVGSSLVLVFYDDLQKIMGVKKVH